jgi:hypothetical protein
MIERIEDMPDGTIGFRASGRIEDDDYEDVLVPGLRRALEAGGGLRMLFVIEDLDAIEGDALWEDSKLEYDMVLRHRKDLVRSAIVTDIAWMARASKLFKWMIPGEAAIFGLAELDRAKAWVAAG